MQNLKLWSWPDADDAEPRFAAAQNGTAVPLPVARVLRMPVVADDAPPPDIADDLARMLGAALVARFRRDEAIRIQALRPGVDHSDPTDAVDPMDAHD